MSIQDKVIIITGASSGIGEATAKLLANQGGKIVLAARREERLKQIAADITRTGGKVIYKAVDVRKPADNAALVTYAKKQYGRVDVIFLNAGIMPIAPLSALKVDEWDDMIDINIKGVLNGIAAVLPDFIAQKSGHIIATSSVAGLKAYPGGAVYGATKWAVRDLMEVLRMESAQEGTNIRTATLYPAAINTELLGAITDANSAKDFDAIYKQYGITPDRVASVVAFAINQPSDVNVSEFTIGPTT